VEVAATGAVTVSVVTWQEVRDVVNIFGVGEPVEVGGIALEWEEVRMIPLDVAIFVTKQE
jgi:hypothetical protein